MPSDFNAFPLNVTPEALYATVSFISFGGDVLTVSSPYSTTHSDRAPHSGVLHSACLKALSTQAALFVSRELETSRLTIQCLPYTRTDARGTHIGVSEVLNHT